MSAARATPQHVHRSQISPLSQSPLSQSPLGQIPIGLIYRIACCCIMTFCCISVVGCGPTLAESRDVELVNAEIKSIILDAVASEQTINIEATAEQPFNLHVYLLENEAALDSELARGVEPTKALAGASDSKSHKLSVVVPAGKEAGVRLEPSSGQASVKLKISN